MQNRNVIKLFAVVFALVCLYQLSFTWIADGVEEDAISYSEQFSIEEQAKKQAFYLDSVSGEEVYDLLFVSYTYSDCQQREINLGLDLKGGMNVTLEVVVVDVIRALSNYNKSAIFNEAISNAIKMQTNSQEDFVTLFGQEYEKLAPNTPNGLAGIFSTPDLREKINFSFTNEEVLGVIATEVEDAINRSFNILRSRIDRFGVTQPNIQRLETAGRILVELPGIKDPERARKLLQSTAQLEFWETYDYAEIFQNMEAANVYLRDQLALNDTLSSIEEKTEENDLSTTSVIDADTSVNDLLDQLTDSLAGSDTSESITWNEFAADNPLYALARPNVNQQGQIDEGPVVANCLIKDTATLNMYLNDPGFMKNFPIDVKFTYTAKPSDIDGKWLQLIALRQNNRDGKPSMDGDVVTDATQTFGQFGNSSALVEMTMNAEGAKQWKRLTAENIGKSVAIILDGYIYSYPTVQTEISGGRSQITGNFSLEEAKDLANILKSGKLPAPARIIEEAIVGPSLGEEAINAGLKSFIIALFLVLLYMIFYYSRAGLVSNVALLANIFFIFGVLSSLGAVLTLPGIAGIVLTIGMSVDANVLIYERIREEIRNGKGIRLAISDGYNNAYSSIIDANVTTLLTGIILYTFGTGPIKGFATTLVIGIITSLFAAIFITRIIISSRMAGGMACWSSWRGWQKIVGSMAFIAIGAGLGIFGLSTLNPGLVEIAGSVSPTSYFGIPFLILTVILFIGKKEGSQGKDVSFATTLTDGAFKNINIDFIGKRKRFYILSSVLILMGLFSLFTKGLNYGVDFLGGRTYVVRFDDSINNEEVRSALTQVFVDQDSLKYAPQVKTFGEDNQVKITTNFLINNSEISTDLVVEQKLNDGLKTIGLDYEIMSSQKVGPTIADDIKDSALWAIIFSLIVIFLYILLRFRKWQFSLGAVTAVFHDVLIVLSLFSILYGFLPFSLEIDQAFIAALLTIIGYSLNDTVVVFDRVREHMYANKRKKVYELMNGALNSTLSRTINTSLTTFFVLFIIFIFGGEVIRGFMFALMIGVLVGTYSSLFVASPIMLDFLKRKE